MAASKMKRQRAGRPKEQASIPAPAALSEDEEQELRVLKHQMRTRPHAPRVEAHSAPGKPLKIDHPAPIDAVRFLAIFGTVEPAFAKSDVVGAAECGL
jgi:hypothetical protein